MEMRSSSLSVISFLLSLLFTSNFNIVVPINAIFNPVTKPVISFCSGFIHTCAVFNTFQMKCWGLGRYGGLSTDYGASPSTVGDNIPFFNPGTSLGIKTATCNNGGTCMLLSSGDIKCVGSNDIGQAGIGSSDTIIRAPTYVGDALPMVNLGTGVKVVSVVAGSNFACAITTAGKIKCFGGNGSGQLGLGDNINRGKLSSDMGENLPYVKLGTSVTVASLHTNANAVHICAILSSPASAAQKFKCWGEGSSYQLGYGTTDSRGRLSSDMDDNLLLVDLGSESRVKYITLGWKHTCALLISNVLKCFGNGANGQLGSGSTSTILQTGDSMPFVPIDSGKSVKFVEAGQQHTCIVYDDQLTLKCFGLNNYGQLGQGDMIQRGDSPTSTLPFILPIDLGTGTLKIALISIGANHNCFILEDNGVKCIGRNDYGLLAIGTGNTIGDGPDEMGSKLEFAEIFSPTQSPTLPTKSPTRSPSPPTRSPTRSPSSSPTKPSKSPSKTPTKRPSSIPTANPSLSPSKTPTVKPTSNPTKVPTSKPTNSPTQPCQYDKSKPCNRDSKCIWVNINGNDQCTLFNCTFLDKGACRNEKKRCTFDKNTKTCIPKI